MFLVRSNNYEVVFILDMCGVGHLKKFGTKCLNSRLLISRILMPTMLDEPLHTPSK